MIEFLVRIFNAGVAHAQTATLDDLDPTPFDDIPDLANSILNRIPYFLGGLALAAIIYSGALYILALGDATKIETAKKNFSWTIVGILATMSIYMVIALIVWLTKSTPIG